MFCSLAVDCVLAVKAGLSTCPLDVFLALASFDVMLTSFFSDSKDNDDADAEEVGRCELLMELLILSMGLIFSGFFFILA